jgi:hypothetical protein
MYKIFSSESWKNLLQSNGPAKFVQSLYQQQSQAKKKLISTAVISGGFLIVAGSFFLTSSNYNNQQLVNGVDDLSQKEEIKGQSNTEQSTVSTESLSQPNSGENTTLPGSNSSISINMHSSVSGEDGTTSQTYVKEIKDGEVVKDTLESTSKDGDSTVRFRIDADSDSKLKIRERDGSIKIDYDQNSRVRN